MKKKLVAFACAFALVLALPASAYAADEYNSPTQSATTESTNGITATVSGTSDATFGPGAWIKVEETSEVASNVPSGVTPLVSFKATQYNVTFGLNGATLTFNLGKEYANYNVVVYIEHDSTDGTTDVAYVTSNADGTIVVPVKGFSTFSIVLGDKVSTSDTAATTTASTTGKDTSAKSPKTGVDYGVAGVAVASLAGAACAAYALRRKVTE